MSISIQNIAERFHAKAVINAPEYVSIRNVCLIDENLKQFRNDTIYVGSIENSSDLFNQNNTVNLICLNAEADFNAYLLCPHMNILFITDLLEPSKIIDEIVRMIEEEDFLTRCSLQLYEALSSNRGLQHIVDVAFSLFNNPVLVSDTSFKLLAHSENPDMHDELWLKITQSGYHPKEYIRKALKDKLTVDVFSANKPVIKMDEDTKNRYISKKIDISGRGIGFATALEYNCLFKDCDIYLFEVLCKVLACEFSKSTYISQSRGLMYEYLLIELLENDSIKKELIEERVQYINLKLKDNLFVFTAIMMNEYALNNVHLSYLCNELESIVPNGKCIIYQDRLVMLISQNHKGDPFHDKSRELLDRFLEENHLIGSISRRFSNICKVKEHYQQACDAIKIGMHLDHGKRLYEYEPYWIYNLLDITSNYKELCNFCDPKLLEVLAYDKEYQTNYAHTLYTYLISNQNPVTTAHKLEIHRNTIDYRINKISNLFCIEMEDSDVILSLNLSFKILIYLGEGNFIK